MQERDLHFYHFEPIPGVKYKYDYRGLAEDLNKFKLKEDVGEARKLLKTFGRNDFFFLGYFILNLQILNHPFAIGRINTVEQEWNWMWDLWAREHLKTLIKTFLLPLSLIINDPEERIAIFSHTKTAAMAYVFRLMEEMRKNYLLRHLWPEIFYLHPETQSPKWSAQEGCLVKRKGNWTQRTLEPYGLNENVPAGPRFSVILYEDAVDKDGTTTPELRKKILENYRMTLNLAQDAPGLKPTRYTGNGTPYHYGDLYAVLEEEGDWTFRKQPATEDGTKEGKPVFWTKETFQRKWRTMGSYTASAQLLLKPVADEDKKFKLEWIDGKRYTKVTEPMTIILLVDPAGEKRKEKIDPDYTVFVLIGVDSYYRRYLLGGRREKITNTQKWKILKHYYITARPEKIGYEEYGMQADISYFKERAEIEGLSIHDKIIPLGGKLAKPDRIATLVPNFENGMFFLPYTLPYKKIDGKEADFVNEFIDEYDKYPAVTHDDILDATARINDEKIGLVVPENSYDIPFQKSQSPLDTIDEYAYDEGWETL